MARRGFANAANVVALVGTLDGTSSSNTVTVTPAPSGWPAATPYFAAIDAGTASEEVVLVTNVVGAAVTITRGSSLPTTYGSTTKAHNNAATIKHVATAADFDEANAHVNSTHLATTDVVLTVGGSTVAASAAGVKPLVLKGAASQTANLQEWQDSTGAVVGHVTSGGRVNVGGATDLLGVLGVASTGATAVGLRVRGFASQTGNLQEWQNSSGVPLTLITAGGGLRSPTVNLYENSDATNGTILAVISAPGGKGLVVKGAASQSANLLDLQDSGSVTLVRVRSSGTGEFNYGLYTQGPINNSPASGHVLIDNTGTNGTVDSRLLILTARASQTANMIEARNSSGTPLFAVGAAGRLTLNSADMAASTATAGSASALPGAPAGYIQINTSGGGTAKIPYWNT